MVLISNITNIPTVFKGIKVPANKSVISTELDYSTELLKDARKLGTVVISQLQNNNK